jgi:hypothetical protein
MPGLAVEDNSRKSLRIPAEAWRCSSTRKNASVAAWYASYGLPLPDAPHSLLLPLATVEAALNASQMRLPLT